MNENCAGMSCNLKTISIILSGGVEYNKYFVHCGG